MRYLDNEQDRELAAALDLVHKQSRKDAICAQSVALAAGLRGAGAFVLTMIDYSDDFEEFYY